MAMRMAMIMDARMAMRTRTHMRLLNRLRKFYK